uniref:Uncharacterized protein n=1 Tax=Setaria italica TaxID=4555 RepID=K3Z277_SETIT
MLANYQQLVLVFNLFLMVIGQRSLYLSIYVNHCHRLDASV